MAEFNMHKFLAEHEATTPTNADELRIAAIYGVNWMLVWSTLDQAGVMSYESELPLKNYAGTSNECPFRDTPVTFEEEIEHDEVNNIEGRNQITGFWGEFIDQFVGDDENVKTWVTLEIDCISNKFRLTFDDLSLVGNVGSSMYGAIYNASVLTDDLNDTENFRSFLCKNQVQEVMFYVPAGEVK